MTPSCCYFVQAKAERFRRFQPWTFIATFSLAQAYTRVCVYKCVPVCTCVHTSNCSTSCTAKHMCMYRSVPVYTCTHEQLHLKYSKAYVHVYACTHMHTYNAVKYTYIIKQEQPTEIKDTPCKCLNV